MTAANDDKLEPTSGDNRVAGDRDIYSGAPKGPITDSMKKPLPKRFYKTVSVEVAPDQDAAAVIRLDGRSVKTPGKRPLLLPSRAFADAVAREWLAQVDTINPATMPLTRFANTAIDAVAASRPAVAADIASYAGSDLVCYRAATPHELVRGQAAVWDPVIAWASSALNARFVVATGVMPVEQPPDALVAFAAALPSDDAFRLTALHVMTTLTGSALLTMAHARGFLSADQAWTAAHIDEDYQISLWGADAQAADRRAGRYTEFTACANMLAML